MNTPDVNDTIRQESLLVRIREVQEKMAFAECRRFSGMEIEQEWAKQFNSRRNHR